MTRATRSAVKAWVTNRIATGTPLVFRSLAVRIHAPLIAPLVHRNAVRRQLPRGQQRRCPRRLVGGEEHDRLVDADPVPAVRAMPSLRAFLLGHRSQDRRGGFGRRIREHHAPRRVVRRGSACRVGALGAVARDNPLPAPRPSDRACRVRGRARGLPEDQRFGFIRRKPLPKNA